MTEPTPVQQLTPEMRDLLAAIRDALDLPLPGFTEADQDAYDRIHRARAVAVISATGVALTVADGAGIVHVPTLTDSIRAAVERHPVTYTVWPPAEPATDGGGQA